MRNPFVHSEPLSPRLHAGSLHQRREADIVSQLIDARSYVLILGPRYSGRTTLLKQLCSIKTADMGYAAVYVHPDMLDLTTHDNFFISLKAVIEDSCKAIVSHGWPADLPDVRRSDDFNKFLNDLMKRFSLCVLLAFDDIEDIPPDILTRLANIAHAVYSERSLHLEFRNLCILFAGSTSLRYLTYKERPHLSPFNVCEDVVLADISTDRSRRFLEGVVERNKLPLRDDAIQAIVEYAGGDLNSLQQVAQGALSAARRGQDIGRASVVNAVEMVTGIKGNRASEALRRIAMSVEEDRSVLDLVLELFDKGMALYVPNSDDQELFSVFQITAQEMSGALRLERRNGEPVAWHFRNKLTELF